MQPGQQQAFGNLGYPVVSPVTPTTQNSSNGNLWGSSVRRAMGISQIICGVIEFALGIALVCLPMWYFYHDNAAWGIWNGVYAVITGCFGVYSKRSKCMVIAYMVLSIIAAVMSGVCCISTSAVTPYLRYESANQGVSILSVLFSFTYILKVDCLTRFLPYLKFSYRPKDPITSSSRPKSLGIWVAEWLNGSLESVCLC
ncbi:hypothetical protein HOLleu_44487 [Holothuria leucospilota]|uniref:Uncharacterized protein n=1 Tax=Holothuria leucospilota TaxID=206669 RepID=A0A9Q1BAV8_HOLLE|nr:hypothetical protein HOLleu_44487 [Holothuria leucospilota]